VFIEEYALPEVHVEPWSAESLDEARIQGLIRTLKPCDDVIGNRQFGVHVIESTEDAADIGRFVEAKVFNDHFGNDLEVMKREYGPYDEQSTFLVAIDYQSDKPVGVIRIIRPSEAGLKSMHDLINPNSSPWFRHGDTEEKRFNEVGQNPYETVDIATMAIMPSYRSNHAKVGASASLYSTCVRWSLANGFNQWITIVDKNIYEMMQGWGEPFKTFEGAGFAPYLDSSESLPVHTELISGLEKIRKFDAAMSETYGTMVDIHGLYTKGEGLHDMFVLPEFSDTVQ
jgi:hypothetical protein